MADWKLSAFADEAAADLEDQLAVLGRQGIGHLELRNAWGTNVIDLDRSQLRRARSLLEGAGIDVPVVGSPVGKSGVADPAEREMERLDRALDAAGELGAGMVRIFSFYVQGDYEGGRREVLERLSRMAEEAQRRGVVLVLENEAYLYGDVPERCREIVETVASPALGVAFDPANYVLANVDPVDRAWPLLAPHVRHVHVKDSLPHQPGDAAVYPRPVATEVIMGRIRPAGEGSARLAEVLRLLRERGYDGLLTVEPHLATYLGGTPEERFGVAVAAVRRLISAG